jgi:nitrous oxide reductase accessory protein NosL
VLAECSSERMLKYVFSVFTDPESITGINATYISDTEITLTWDLPEGEYNAFEVKRRTSSVQNYFYPVPVARQVGKW